MDSFISLLHGFQVVLTPVNIIFMFVGVLLGVVIGVLPGLGAANGIAILLPLTFGMSPTSAIIMLSCIYWGALFGGAITSVLFNIPGEPWSVATTFDGHPLAQKGRAGEALTASFTSSFFGAFIAVILITFLAPIIASFALQFGPAEFFAVQLLTFCSFVGMSKESPFKTLASMMIGFALAAVGLDTVTGQLRMTFGSMQLLNGFNFPGRSDRPVRHRRDHADDGGGARVQGQQRQDQHAGRARHLEAIAPLLGHHAAQRRHRLLARHHPWRRDPRLLHELRIRQAVLEGRRQVRHRASSKAWSRRKPRRTPPAQARCCRC